MTLLPQPLVIDTYMLQKLGQQIFVTNLEKKWGSLDSERVKEVIYSLLVRQKAELFSACGRLNRLFKTKADNITFFKDFAKVEDR